MRLIALATLALIAGPAFAKTLFEDDFTADVTGLNAELLHWRVVQGSVDAITSCGGTCIDLDGSTPGSAPTILTTREKFRFEPGMIYELSFEFPTGTQADAFTAGVAKAVRVYDGYALPLKDTIRFTVGATGFEAPIVFALNTRANNNYGPYLGRVVLREGRAAPARRLQGP